VAEEAGAAATGSGKSVGHEEVDLDAVGRLPLARVLLEFEPLGLEEVADARRVCEELRCDGQVGVDGELGHGQVGGAGVQVDGLSADHDDRAEVRLERGQPVEQCPAGEQVEGVRFARHPCCPSSR
jgi:hypothetical protein